METEQGPQAEWFREDKQQVPLGSSGKHGSCPHSDWGSLRPLLGREATEL